MYQEPFAQTRPLTHQEAPGHPALAQVQAGREAARKGARAASAAHRHIPRKGEAQGNGKG